MNAFYMIELTQHALKDLDRLKEQSAKVQLFRTDQ